MIDTINIEIKMVRHFPDSDIINNDILVNDIISIFFSLA